MLGFDHTSGKYHKISDDANIYYEITGNIHGPAILLLHGGFGSIEDFNTVLPIITDNYCIIGIDSRGHGKSTMGHQKLSYEAIQRDVESVLGFLNIKKLSIMGFSDGGIVAYRLAASGNLVIDKLITIGSRWCINDALLSAAIFLKITPESWKTKFPATYALYEELNPAPDFDSFTNSIIAMWLDDGVTGYPSPNLKNFSSPVLIVRGDTDHLLSRQSVTELGAVLKNSMLLTIPFAGHAAFSDQPDIFRITLQQFLG